MRVPSLPTSLETSRLVLHYTNMHVNTAEKDDSRRTGNMLPKFKVSVSAERNTTSTIVKTSPKFRNQDHFPLISHFFKNGL
jgi:hypothetical protein